MESFALLQPSWIWLPVGADRSFFSFSSINGSVEPLSGSTDTPPMLFVLSAAKEKNQYKSYNELHLSTYCV